MDIDKIAALLSQSDLLKPQYEAVNELRERVKGNNLVMTVVGQFKRGKSSFINALLGEELLPTGIIPLTSAVTELRRSPELRAEVVHAGNEPREINISQLGEYCSEEKNPENIKNIHCVRIFTPKMPFPTGCVLVDTPGVGSVNKGNTDCSYEYVEKSDVLIFLLSVDSPVSESERHFLLKCKDHAAALFFAVNKADRASPEELESFCSYCRGVIKNDLGTEADIQPVSARTGLGIEELKRKINEALAKSGRIFIESSVVIKLDSILSRARASLELALASSALPAERLMEKLSRTEEQSKSLDGFYDELELLSRHRAEKLIQSIALNLKAPARELEKGALELCRSLCVKLSGLSTAEYKKRLEAETAAFLAAGLERIECHGRKMLSDGYRETADALSAKAEEAGLFLNSILKDEFGIDYPINRRDFSLSERSDLILHIGRSERITLGLEDISCLLPGKLARDRYFRQSLKQISDDVERNMNNIIYSYRYTLQESLRDLCSELKKSIEDMQQNFTALLKGTASRLENASAKKEEEQLEIKKLLTELESLMK